MSNKEEIKDVRLARFARCEKCKYSQYYKNTLLLKCKKLKAAFFDIAICPITKEKIEQKTKQHEVIGAKIDCPHFSTIGNLCSRVQNGMMRCDEYLECEFKYIDKLEEENKHYKQIAQHHGDMSIKYTNKCAKYKQILQDIKNLVTTDYIQIKRQLVQNYDLLDNFMQKIEDKCNEVQ